MRIDVGGAMACEELSAGLDARRLVLVGDGAAAIAAAMTLSGAVVGGTMRFDGHDVATHSHVGKVGLAPSEMPLIPHMTVLHYLAASFELGEVPRATAQQAAAAALRDAGLGALAGRKTESLALPERKVVLIAQAMAPGLASLFVETPLAGLEGPAARYVIDVLERVAQTRRWAATAAHADAAASERELMMACDRVAMVGSGEVEWEGAPSALMGAGTVYTVGAHGEVDAFRTLLADCGCTVQGAGQRFAVTVPASGAASQILDWATQSGAVVVELVPVLPTGR